MIIYAVPFIISLFGYFLNINESQKKKIIYLFTVFTCLLLIATLKAPSVGTDMRTFYIPYYPQFANVSWDNVQHVTNSEHWELGYCLYCKFLCQFSTEPQFFIFVTSIITVVPFALFIYKNSEDVVFATVYYIGFHIYTMLLSPARQAIAVAIIVAFGYEQLKRKNYIKYCIVVYIAYLFHSSAICAVILLVCDFLRFNKKSVGWLTLGVAFFAVSYSTIIPYLVRSIGLSSAYDIYTIGQKHAKGYITIHTLSSFLIPLMIFLIFARWYDSGKECYLSESGKVKRKWVLGSRLCLVRKEYPVAWHGGILAYGTFLIVLFRFCAFLVNVIARMSFYFMPFIMISYPFARRCAEDTTTKKNLDIIVYGSLILFFFYILIFRAESLWGIVPYRFFWE